MTVARFESCEAGVYADVGWRLIDSESETGNFDGGVWQRKEVGKGELGGRHGGLRLGLRIVVSLSFSFAFVCGLKLGR